jgi:hypothetical protein
MKKIIEFLRLNGYTEDTEKESGYRSFYKEGVSTIDVNKNEIVLVGESGDWLQLPFNIYALIGALIHHRQIAVDYKY